MRKGTSPVFEFTLPFDTELVAKAKVTFKYDDYSKVTKYANKDDFNGNTISVKLTQDETFMFKCNSYIKVQLRVLTTGGDPLATEPYTVFVEECLDDEVLE